MVKGAPRMAPRGPVLTQVKKQSRTNNHRSQQSKGWQQKTAKGPAENSQNNYGKMTMSSYFVKGILQLVRDSHHLLTSV